MHGWEVKLVLATMRRIEDSLRTEREAMSFLSGGEPEADRSGIQG